MKENLKRRRRVLDYSLFKASLDRMRYFHPERGLTNEPEFHYFDSLEGAGFAHRYAEEYQQLRVTKPGVKGVLYAAVPAPDQLGRRACSIIYDSLLVAAGERPSDRGEDAYQQGYRLQEAVWKGNYDLVLIDHLHHLVTPGRRQPRLKDFYYLFYGLKNEVKPVHVLFVGEIDVLEQLIGQDECLIRRSDQLLIASFGSARESYDLTGQVPGPREYREAIWVEMVEAPFD